MSIREPEQLIRLPDGSWVDPAAVELIRALPRECSASGTLHAPRLTVWFRGGFNCVTDYESDEDALAARDLLAAEVNAARRREDGS